MANSIRASLFLVFVFGGSLLHAASPELKLLTPSKFTTAQSCQSSSCHGGGVGKDQSILWEKKDPHSRAHAILSTARSTRMAEALKIESPQKSSRCNACHAPMKALPPERLVKGAVADNAVSCENCHGPAEVWLQFHTRTDVTHQQRVAAGLRELTDLYARANACVACHLNIDSELVAKAKHPEMFFELDGQMGAQPPHYQDEGKWVGPRAWLTGQAVVLRELSWKLSKEKDESLLARQKALLWLLRKGDLIGSDLSENTDFTAVQTGADRLARNAARDAWSAQKTSKLLATYAGLSNDFRSPALKPAEMVRRAEALVMGLDRLWVASKKENGTKSENLDKALVVLTDLARTQATFDPKQFAAALEQVEVTLTLLGKS